MVDKTRPEAMTAERMKRIRATAAALLDVSRGWALARQRTDADQVCGHDVPALISALEDAQTLAREWREFVLGAAQDMGLTVGPEATGPELLEAIGGRVRAAENERAEAIAASAESARKYAEAVERLRAARESLDRRDQRLADERARVAELEGALATARVKTLEEAERIAEADLLDQPGVIVAAERRCDGGASERAARRIAAKLFQRRSHLMLAVAHPEQASEWIVEPDGYGLLHAELMTELCRPSDGARVFVHRKYGIGDVAAVVLAALNHSKPRQTPEQAPAPPRTDDGARRDVCGSTMFEDEDGDPTAWCSRETGHDGDHEMRDGDVTLARWTNHNDIARPADVGAAPPASTGTDARIDAAFRSARLAEDVADPLCARATLSGDICAHRLSKHGGALLSTDGSGGRACVLCGCTGFRRRPDEMCDCGRPEGHADEDECRSVSTGTAPAAVTVYCFPRVEDRAAIPAGDELLNSPIAMRTMATILNGAPAADPLCARDLGLGRKCGHPSLDHREGRRCMHLDSTYRAVSGRCPCPGFVPPEPAGVVAYCRAETPAGCPTPELFRSEPCGEKCPTPHPCEPAPSGVVDHGTARTCETCNGYGVTCGVPSGVPCEEWAPKSGESSTEVGAGSSGENGGAQ